MPVVASKPLTVEAYLARDRNAEGRLEFLNGTITDVAGAEPEHNQVKDNIAAELRSRLQPRGCWVTTSDQRVHVGNGNYVYPDVVVACDPAYDDEHRPRTSLNPELVVEVTSGSTAARDHGEKLAAYARVAGLHEYWVAEPDRALLTQFVRTGGEDGEWRVQVHDGLGSDVRSEHFDVALPLAALYALVVEEASPEEQDEE
jgi:Uma2 family endonuclease